MLVESEPVAVVVGGRAEVVDDDWGRETAVIRLDAGRFGPEALYGLAEFSHLEVVYHFDRVPVEKVETGARHPGATRTGRWSASSRSAARTGRTGWVSPAAGS